MRVPGYQIEQLIAEGGMSTVYRAVQASLGRTVALKVLKHIDSAQHADRFLREARIVAALEHRNIVTIHDVGSVGERYYIAMEILEGGSLADRIEHGLPAAQALELIEAIAGCLDFVHRRGIVHRDIKPSNILFHADGTPKLSDFGIAKELEDDQENTLDGSCFGSPYYLSPEQAEGRPLDGRSDIYSLGIVFHQMLTGRRPYAESSHIETIVAHLSLPIPVLPNGLARYQRLLEDMIAKDPDDRIGSAALLVERVRTLREPGVSTAAASGAAPPVATSDVRRAPLPVTLALLTAAAGLGWWLLDDGSPVEPPTAAAVATPLITATTAQRPARVAAPVAVAAVRAPQAAPSTPAAVQHQPGNAAMIVSAAEPPAAAGIMALAPAPETDDAPSDPPIATRAPPADLGDTPPLQADNDPAERTVQAALAPAGDAAMSPPADAAMIVVDRRAARIETLMRQAEKDLRAKRLTRPAGNSAHDRYLEVLELEPGHTGALAGIDKIAARYAAMAGKALDNGDRERAALYLRRSRQVRPDHPDLIAAHQFLATTEAPPMAATPVVVEAAAEPRAESLRGPGSGNIVRDFKKLWRSVFD